MNFILRVAKDLSVSGNVYEMFHPFIETHILCKRVLDSVDIRFEVMLIR
jgi:hypothetical protein